MIIPFCIVLSGFSTPSEAALAHLESQGVHLPRVAWVQKIEAPLEGWLVDVVGFRQGVCTAFRVGIPAGGAPGEVFCSFSYSGDAGWDPADTSDLQYEFLMEQNRIFQDLGSPPPGEAFASGERIPLPDLIAALRDVDVVFVGENHDDPVAHAWELFLWRFLAEPDRALALEMFETDVQESLDRYLSGELQREEFLAVSRPWGNYPEAYEPLVDHARGVGSPVIAANVPRRHAAAVAREGWGALSGHPLMETLAVDSSNAEYRERFLAVMEALGDRMHSMETDPMNLYRAQLLKDAVMAASVEGRRCLFVCGSFHSDRRSGIPDQLSPGIAFLTVKVLSPEEPADPASADFLVIR